MPRHTDARHIVDEVVIEGTATRDAVTIIVFLRGNEEEPWLSASGTAKRGPGDKTDRLTGVDLAVARALESLARKLRKEVREVTG